MFGYHLHFVVEKTEAQRSQVSYLRSQSWLSGRASSLDLESLALGSTIHYYYHCTNYYY